MVWQHLIKHWLRQEAGRRIRDTVSATANEEASPADDRDEAADAESAICHVGIVVNNAAVAGSLLDQLDGVLKTHAQGFKAYAGGLSDRHVIVIQADEGIAAAATATRLLLTTHQPQWVLSAGFASGLVPELNRGDLVLANGVADTSGRRLAIAVKPDESDPEKPAYHVGRVLTLEQPVEQPDEKRQLGRLHEAIAADTSSLAVAEACREANVLCLAVCVILDAVDDQLPNELRNMSEQESLAGKLGAATGALLNRPSSAKDWWNVKQETLKSADILAQFLVGMVRRLVPRDRLRPQ